MGRSGWTVDIDPDPDSEIALTFEEFAAAVDQLRAVGFPVEREAAEAWPHFRGWRVNYEALAYALAYRTDQVPAPWSGPRRWGADDHTCAASQPQVARQDASPIKGPRAVTLDGQGQARCRPEQPRRAEPGPRQRRGRGGPQRLMGRRHLWHNVEISFE